MKKERIFVFILMLIKSSINLYSLDLEFVEISDSPIKGFSSFTSNLLDFQFPEYFYSLNVYHGDSDLDNKFLLSFYYIKENEMRNDDQIFLSDALIKRLDEKKDIKEIDLYNLLTNQDEFFLYIYDPQSIIQESIINFEYENQIIGKLLFGVYSHDFYKSDNYAYSALIILDDGIAILTLKYNDTDKKIAKSLIQFFNEKDGLSQWKEPQSKSLFYTSYNSDLGNMPIELIKLKQAWGDVLSSIKILQ